jgi:hypothetical protein
MYLLHFLQVYKVRCKEDGKLYAVKRSHERFRGNQCNFVLILRHEQNNAVAGWFNRSSIFAQ